jgi:cobalt-zinc-cadmium efflux system outer membrane protein
MTISVDPGLTKKIRHCVWLVLLFLLYGCSFNNWKINKEIEMMTRHLDEITPHPVVDLPPPTSSAPTTTPPGSSNTTSQPQQRGTVPPAVGSSDQSTPASNGQTSKAASPPANGDVQTVAFIEQPGGSRTETPRPRKRLIIPPELPGADEPPLKLPEDRAEREKYLKELFPAIDPPPTLPPLAPGPEGHPMTLADLQRYAAMYNPAIKSALAAVEAAKGAVKQAGAYPNPTVFFEQDTVGTGPAGYEGFGMHQTVKTANKLKLQQASAMMDLMKAQLALRRAYTDVAYQVRGYYFAQLVAREAVKRDNALFRFSEEIYKIQLELLMTGGFAAVYEPIQLRTLVDQSRINLIQSQNVVGGSWKQLAAVIGLRDMPPTELAGRIDMPVPNYDYKTVLDKVLENHTDVRTAFKSLQQAQFNLELAKVTPIPDVDLNLLAQKDYTAPPNVIAHSLQFALPMPIWNQNKGGIKQAAELVAQAQAGVDVARNNLTITLADAFNRYQAARQVVRLSLRQVRDQIIYFRNLYARWQQQPEVIGLVDIINAQQTLATYLQQYITALGQQWQAVVDVANLLQTDDLFQTGPLQEMAPVPDLLKLLPPCRPVAPTGKPLSQQPASDRRDSHGT